jgi:hypothetical protein
MVKTNELLIAKLQWPAPAKTLTDKDLRHHRKTLAAARRCLHEHAPITFFETGFQLLKQSKEAEMVECLNLCLAEINIEVDDVLVMLSANPCDEYGEYFYKQSFNQYLNEIGENVLEIREKAKDKTPRVDAFNQVFRQLETLTTYVQSDKLVKLHTYLVKLEDFDYVDQKDKGVNLLGKLAKMMQEIEL